MTRVLVLFVLAAIASGCPSPIAAPDAPSIDTSSRDTPPATDTPSVDAPSLDAPVLPDAPEIFPREEGSLVATTALADDRAGGSVAISADGSRVIVGAPSANPGGMMDAGAAYVFRREGSTWVEEAMLTAADGAVSDQFGVSVALSADGLFALVGAYNDDVGAAGNAGSAHFYRRTGTTWAEDAAPILSPTPAGNDRFGVDVSLSADGTVALIGADYTDTSASVDAGAARIFRRMGAGAFASEATFFLAAGAPSDEYGSSVGLSADGERAIVGSNSDDTTLGVDAGSASIYVHGTGTTWTLEQTITLGGAGDRFGVSVALDQAGTRAIVGAYFRTSTDGDVGSAFVLLRSGSTWAEEGEIFAPDGAALDVFGQVCGISGDGSVAWIGGPGLDGAAGTDAGGVGLSRRDASNEWPEATILTSMLTQAGDALGVAVAISADGRRGVATAPRANTVGGDDTGRATVFVLGP